ncbi:NADH-quinone oxidoreductase subunit D [Carboxydothermus pertinax]|uniref:NADH-quinone oxidoreductase subunit D n=1 Tax=Carboxydothermus pertinax TaxID=870242 RepID=A0A1L8CXK8_9THEO|nr:NADH-quinone oxidoreductase subunit D [Carboxydothermus pertinax]GAV23665.1 NADH-quinone oxidoreductase subunit D [Carboxydothermus pertinax]
MLKTQEIAINVGPQHPSTHGVFRIILKLDGETIVDAEPVVGYLHRGIEKLAEDRTYTQVIPYTDRMDYLGAMSYNLGYVQTVEKLMGIEVPERAEFIRVIATELSRIASHHVFLASMSLDMGSYTGWMYPFRDRELVLELLEMLSGSRMTFSFMRIGGVADDLPEGFIEKAKEYLPKILEGADEEEGLLAGNEIFIARTKGLAPVSVEKALAWGWGGANLRASGFKFDLRKNRPYSVYDRFDFDIPTGSKGDCWDRFYLRLAEIRQSVKIIEQALEMIPEGPIMAKVPKVIKPPVGEAYHEVEAPKGILGYYIVSDGSTKPYRMHVRRPSYINIGMLRDLLIGTKLADFITIFASIDVVLGDVDC